MSITKKERRDDVLYVHVKKSNKKWLKDNYKKHGYSTLSEFVDTIIDSIKAKAKK